MRTYWIVSLALIGFGCASTSSEPALVRNDEPRVVNVPVPIRGDTGSKDAADVVDLAHVRITRAYDILAERGSCYLPARVEAETLVFSDSKRWVMPMTQPPLSEPGQRTDLSLADWARFDPDQEDYDFLGVDVDLSADQRAIVVTSKFGFVPGLLRVAEWIREKLKAQ